jgi:hypothetical protein
MTQRAGAALGFGPRSHTSPSYQPNWPLHELPPSIDASNAANTATDTIFIFIGKPPPKVSDDTLTLTDERATLFPR